MVRGSLSLRSRRTTYLRRRGEASCLVCAGLYGSASSGGRCPGCCVSSLSSVYSVSDTGAYLQGPRPDKILYQASRQEHETNQAIISDILLSNNFVYARRKKHENASKRLRVGGQHNWTRPQNDQQRNRQKPRDRRGFFIASTKSTDFLITL